MGIIGTLYGINTAAVEPQLRTFAAGMTVSFQNVFGYAFGPLIPGAVASVTGRCIDHIWPNVEWNAHAINGATFAAGMSFAMSATWLLVLFTAWGAYKARVL